MEEKAKASNKVEKKKKRKKKKKKVSSEAEEVGQLNFIWKSLFKQAL